MGDTFGMVQTSVQPAHRIRMRKHLLQIINPRMFAQQKPATVLVFTMLDDVMQTGQACGLARVEIGFGKAPQRGPKRQGGAAQNVVV